MNRYERALQQKIYLLNTEEHNESMDFDVRGSTNNIYNIKLDKINCTCTCPDFQTRNNICKHILFIIAKIGEETTIANNLFNFNNIYDENIYTIIIQSIKNRLNKIRKERNKKNKKKKDNIVCSKKDEICCICFEELNNDLYHEKNCNNYFHNTCIDKWLQNKDSCPLCRKTLFKNNINENDNGIDKNLKIKFLK